jgi:hypothetical protein
MPPKPLERRLDSALGKVGLSGAKASVLHALGQEDQALTLSQLADENCCVRSNITQLVDVWKLTAWFEGSMIQMIGESNGRL